METYFYYKNNRLQQLRGFCYTVQLGSVSKAAEKMGLQQCSVSTQIKSLERDLGIQLFTRNGIHLHVSNQGTLLYDMVLPHIEMMDDLPANFKKSLQKKLEENLTLAANQASMTYIVPGLISKCKEKYPATKILIRMQNYKDAEDLLRHDEIQAYIGPKPSSLSPEFIFHDIGSYEVILIAHKDHPLTTKKDFHISDISRYKTVITTDRQFISIPFFEELLEQYQVDIYAKIENIDWEILKSFVACTDTFTIVTTLCYDPSRDYNIGTRSLKDIIPNMHYGIITKKNKFQTDSFKALLDAAKVLIENPNLLQT